MCELLCFTRISNRHDRGMKSRSPRNCPPAETVSSESVKPSTPRDAPQAVTADRERLSAISSGAIRAKANMEPLKFVSMQADAAAQTAFALPMCSPLTHGTDRSGLQI